MNSEILNFVQTNSPDGGFLQSEYWRKFQEGVVRKTYSLSETSENGELIAFANIIAHKLPIVGDYFYAPRGPIIENFKFQISNFKSNPNDKIQNFLNDLTSLARENNISWIRIEPANEDILVLIKKHLPKGLKFKKSSVDMQPREILVLDISGSKEEILARMKQKTRYNIRLSEKKEVKILVSRQEKHIDGFCRLTQITAKRDKITSHPENYYRKMFEIIPPEILKLYIAEYEGKVIAANLVLFFGKIATYMHGASDNAHRNVMAPHLLQWQAIKDAKISGCMKYDLGGVRTVISEQRTVNNSWGGITKFKQGFAPGVEPIQFPGCYDIVLDPFKYNLYRILQRIKKIV